MIATIIASAKLIGITPSLLLGLCSVESSLQNIVNKNDFGSASYGICQVKENTKKHVISLKKFPPCVSVFKKDQLMDISYNSCIAAKYLKYQMERYKGNVRKALSAYNAGRYVKHNKKYVNKVLSRKKYMTKYTNGDSRGKKK